MSDFRFLHAADIHLDSPLTGLRARSEEVARQFAAATRTAFSRLIDAAIDCKVAFVVIAGDLYDGDWKDYATGQFFVREAGRLARAGIALHLVRGNHDAASEISRTLPLPANVHQFSAHRVESLDIAELGVVLHGRSFAHRQVTENVAGEFPAARPGWFNIGILHTSLTGREGHDVYAPCSLDDLLRTGYQYWALGHIHAREVVHADPPVVFSGNLQGRHVRETGPKGATLVTVDGHRIAGLEALALDAARWESMAVQLDGLDDERAFHAAVRDRLIEAARACDDKPMAVRLRLAGATGLHPRLCADRSRLEEEVQALAAAVSDRLLIEKVVVDTTEPKALAGSSLPIADLEEALGIARADADFRRQLADTLALIRGKAPREALALLAENGGEGDIDALLAGARDLVLARLASPTPEAGDT